MFTSFLIEGLIVVCSGIMLGVILSQAAFWVVEKATGYLLDSSLGTVLLSALISFVVYMISAAIPADMARHTSVIDLILERPLRSSLEEDPTQLHSVRQARRSLQRMQVTGRRY